MGWFKRHRKRIAKYAGVLVLALSGLAYSMHRSPRVEVENTVDGILGGSIRVMSANIARGQGHSFHPGDFFDPSGQHLEGINVLEQIIVDNDVDIGCFQEVETGYVCGEHQPERMSRNMHLSNYVFGQNFSFQLPFMPSMWFAYGNSIHSRSHIHKPENVAFDSPSLLTKLIKPFAGVKGILHAQVYYKKVPINIICTHLSSERFSKTEREYEFKTVFEYAAHHTPAVVMGDFNTVPLGARGFDYPEWFSEDYAGEMSWYLAKSVEAMHGVAIQFDSRLHLFDEDVPPDFPSTYIGSARRDEMGGPVVLDPDVPKKTIDYILVITHPDDNIKLKLKDTRVYYDKRCSDHAPVIADIEVEE